MTRLLSIQWSCRFDRSKASRRPLEGLIQYFAKVRRRNKLIAYYGVRLTRTPGKFDFQGRTYTYFWHCYNSTWRNERAVEIPIVWELVSKADPAAVLEVGNVLSYYYPVGHDVVDKYDRKAGVINEDIVEFRASKRYALIVCISTLEHVGWDEVPREPAKVFDAYQKLRSLLAPGGRLIVTFPPGYNSVLDRMVAERKISFDQLICMKRVSAANEWREAKREEAASAGFDEAVPTPRGLFIGMIEKS